MQRGRDVESAVSLKSRRGPADAGIMSRHILLALVFALSPAAALAQHEGSPSALETGIGFTSDPTTFLLATELPIRIARDWELGPMVQLGVGDGRLIVAPTVNARYSFPLSRYVTNGNPIWERLSGHDVDGHARAEGHAVGPVVLDAESHVEHEAQVVIVAEPAVPLKVHEA